MYQSWTHAARPWKNRIKLGDLVRFERPVPGTQVSAAGIAAQERYARKHLPHMFEIGLVIDTQGLDPVVSFPSRTQDCATRNLVVL